MLKENNHNLFLGLEVSAPWPDSFPEGRILPEASRHLTLAFLGNVPKEKLLSQLQTFPPPPPLSAAGICDALLFLPPDNPHVVSYNVEWLSQKQELLAFRHTLYEWLLTQGYRLDERPFLSHVTVARSPFNEKQWLTHFSKLPLITRRIHLYESKGNLSYEPIWTHSLTPPFIELSHTGDIAYKIYGKDPSQIYLHAQLALAFEHLPFLSHLTTDSASSLEEIVVKLNEKIAKLDQENGSPFKAVSFHGDLIEENTLIFWEMIVDV